MIEPAHGEQFFERGNVQHAIDILAVASSAYDDSPKQPTQGKVNWNLLTDHIEGAEYETVEALLKQPTAQVLVKSVLSDALKGLKVHVWRRDNGCAGRNSVFYVGFRGTEPDCPENFLTDLKAIPDDLDTRFGGVGNESVHRGFQHAYLALRHVIFNALPDTIQQGDYIIVTGHSLGGALANLACVDLGRQFGGESIHLVSFAAPHVGNKAFAELCEKRCGHKVTRLTNALDPVPYLLDCMARMVEEDKQYVHAGKECALQSKFIGGVKSLTKHGSRGMLASPEAFVENHLLGAYTSALHDRLDGTAEQKVIGDAFDVLATKYQDKVKKDKEELERDPPVQEKRLARHKAYTGVNYDVDVYLKQLYKGEGREAPMPYLPPVGMRMPAGFMMEDPHGKNNLGISGDTEQLKFVAAGENEGRYIYQSLHKMEAIGGGIRDEEDEEGFVDAPSAPLADGGERFFVKLYPSWWFMKGNWCLYDQDKTWRASIPAKSSVLPAAMGEVPSLQWTSAGGGWLSSGSPLLDPRPVISRHTQAYIFEDFESVAIADAKEEAAHVKAVEIIVANEAAAVKEAEIRAANEAAAAKAAEIRAKAAKMEAAKKAAAAKAAADKKAAEIEEAHYKHLKMLEAKQKIQRRAEQEAREQQLKTKQAKERAERRLADEKRAEEIATAANANGGGVATQESSWFSMSSLLTVAAGGLALGAMALASEPDSKKKKEGR